jgi:hypothetical protein
VGGGDDGDAGVDFFVSSTRVDEAWAVWIAWQLEAAGYRVRIQAWDFTAGAHFVQEMHQAVQRAARTVVVLSAAYPASRFAAPEWQAAWAADPLGQDRKLLVVRVEECAWPGLLGQVVSIDLFPLDAAAARDRLLAAAKGARGKPAVEPPFPGRRGGPAYPAGATTQVCPARQPLSAAVGDVAVANGRPTVSLTYTAADDPWRN